jgi:hypothetical protein
MIPRAEKQQVLVATDRPNGRSLRRKASDEASESMFAPVLDYVSTPLDDTDRLQTVAFLTTV